MLFPVSAGTHSCPDYPCYHSVFFSHFVVYFLSGNGDIQLQGPFYFLLSHNVFFPYFVVYFLPWNGDIQLQGLLREHADLEALHWVHHDPGRYAGDAVLDDHHRRHALPHPLSQPLLRPTDSWPTPVLGIWVGSTGFSNHVCC